VAVVLLTLFAPGRRPTLVFGGITTAFVAAGYGVHLARGEGATALANHGIVMGGLWTAVAVVLGYKHVLQSQRESEARAQSILETTVDGIITIDAEGTIESFNPAAEDMAEITEHVKEADQYARDLSHGLIPVDVEGGQPSALPEALRRLADNAERLFNVECSFREVDAAIVLENTVATHLYRIAQEAVNNAVRHGEADHLRIVLAAGEEYLRLQVRDDGSGFEEEDAAADAGMGVRIMNYRARIIGGSLDVSSALGEGTVVTCTVPRTSVEAPATDASTSVSR